MNGPIYLDDVPKSEWKNYIGNGYRSVAYKTDAYRNGQIILFGFDKAGNPATFVCPHQSRIRYNVKYKTDQIDIYDNYVATKYFKNSFDRNKYIENAVGLSIVECLRPEQEFLHDMFDEHVLESDFNKQPLRIHYIDIETEISDQFMKPSQADNRINMITIYDSATEKFYTWSLQHAEKKFNEEPIKNYPISKFEFYEFHDDEVAMLEHFLEWYGNNYPDVSYGWNVRQYDWPYIYTRICKVLGKAQADTLSPVNKCFVKQVNHDNERADVAAEIEVDITGLFIADGLVLYRDKFGISHPDGGFTLDNIGEVEGCGHKIKYDGTLKDLYLKDYQKFYEYNVRDVDLAKRIDDKCKMIQLARQITSFGLTSYGAIYSSISYLIGSVLAFAKTEMGGKVFKSYLAQRQHFDGFEGAFVFPTKSGIYRGGIGTIDFASLYPSNIRSINASPETYVGKILVKRADKTGNIMPINLDNDEAFDVFNDAKIEEQKVVGFELKLPNRKRKEVTLDWIRNIINTKCIYTTNNTLFLKHEVKWGVIAKWCEYFYGLRKSTKKKELACFHKLNDENIVLTEDERAKLAADEEVYHTVQIGIKAMINSIYGCMGTSFSPIANPDIAQSVTRQGRFCNISTEKFIRKRFQEIYGAPDNYIMGISGDTDSIFLNLQCVTDSMKHKYSLPTNIRDWSQKYRNELWKTMSDFVKNEVNPFVRNLVHNYCHTTQQDVLTYELEYMGDCGVYESKKHYFLHKIFEEGDIVDKNKVTGIELKKAQVPKEMKVFLENIYVGVVNKDWNEHNYISYINDLYDKFKNFSIDEVSFWKGYNTERQAVGFLQMQNGTTGIAKACTYYNQIIKKLGLGKKYEEIRVGDKVRFCYIKESNRYSINCIAYKPGSWPKEFDSLFAVDYKVMFKKIILDPLKRFREACHFSDTDPSKQAVQDIFAL